MGVIAVLVLMLAHLVLRNEWLSLLGRGTTHHLVLLDDSYSMSDRWNETTAFNEGKRAVQAIVDQASQQSDTQLVTLLRFSEAARLSAGAQPKVFAEPINDTFRSRLESLLAGWEASQTDVGPADALKAIPRLPLADEEQSLIVYLVSDFRARQFTSATEIRKLLADLKEKEHVSQIHLVRCVREARPNLADQIACSRVGRSRGRRRNVDERHAWPIMAMCRLAASPCSWSKMATPCPPWCWTTSRRATKSRTSSACSSPARAPTGWPPRSRPTPSASITAATSPAICRPPGRCSSSMARQMAAAAASFRWPSPPAATPAPVGSRTSSRPRSWPMPNASTSRRPCACSMCRHLNDDELAALKSYVRVGGGVAFFLGANTDRGFYNDRLFKNGEGLFPAPLKLPTQLLDREGEATPDVEVTQHPLFQVLAGRRNGFLPLLMVDYFYALQDDWQPPTDGSTQVIARLRNNAPLVIEKKFGKGRVIAQLTKLSTGDTPLGRWTNWSLNPAFPVLANELVSYLAVAHDDRPAAEHRRRPGRLRRRGQIRIPLPLPPARQTWFRRGRFSDRETQRCVTLPPRNHRRSHRRQQPPHRQARKRFRERHLRSRSSNRRPAHSNAATSP